MKAKNRKKWLLIPLAVLLTIAVAFLIYVNLDVYEADASVQAILNGQGAISCTTLSDGTVVLSPEHPQVGLIFYPGAKVEHTAYAPLMEQLAEKGLLCAIVKMPFRLAVLDLGDPADIQAQFPEITRWYLGGHSLGGAMAAYDAEKGNFEGLLLLAAYSNPDLSQSGLRVISVYGSEDHVLQQDKYDQCRANLPADFAELVIDGGCHAWFGAYGPQKGDGIPTITAEQQTAQTTDFIANCIFPAA